MVLLWGTENAAANAASMARAPVRQPVTLRWSRSKYIASLENRIDAEAPGKAALLALAAGSAR